MTGPRISFGLAGVSALASLAFLVAACGSVRTIPTPSIELETPETWSAAPANPEPAAPGTNTDAWWQQFGDPQLDRWVEAALEHNPSLEVAAANLDAALAQARIDGAALSPALSAGQTASRRKQNFIGFPIPGSENRVLSTSSTNLGLSLNVSWEADLWGRLRAQKAAAWADAAARERDLQGARLSLAGQMTKAWFAAAEAQQQVGLSEETLASRRRSEERVMGRYRRGLSPSLEVRLARAQSETVAAQLAQQRQVLDAARRQLEVLAGGYPNGETETGAELPGLPPAIPPGVPAELLARRPDLAAAEHRAFASSARLRAARRALYPTLSLTGSSGTASGELGDLLDGNFSVWALASSLLQPVFQGGRLRAGVDAREAGLEAAEAAWLQATLQAFLEVETALAAEPLLEQRARALDLAVGESRAAERLALDRYTRGLIDYLSVLDTQRSAFAAESQRLGALRQRLNARVDLILALGGGIDSAGSSVVDAATSSPPSEDLHR